MTNIKFEEVLSGSGLASIISDPSGTGDTSTGSQYLARALFALMPTLTITPLSSTVHRAYIISSRGWMAACAHSIYSLCSMMADRLNVFSRGMVTALWVYWIE